MEDEERKRKKGVPRLRPESQDPSIYLQDLSRLRRWMKTKELCERFVDGQSPQFRAFLSLTEDKVKQLSVMMGDKQTEAMMTAETNGENSEDVLEKVVAESLALFANCTFFSLTAQLEAKRGDLLVLMGDFLSTERISLELKSTVSRLLSNLCSRKEVGCVVVQNENILPALSSLLQASSSNPDHKLIKNGLRVFRKISDLGRNFRRALIGADVPYSLGTLISKMEEYEELQSLEKDIFNILNRLCEEDAVNCGKQLSRTEAANKLFGDEISSEERRLVFFKLLRLSCDMRGAFISAGLVEYLDEKEKCIARNTDHEGNKPKPEFLTSIDEERLKIVDILTSLAQDASGRAKIRNTGLISMFMEAFGLTEFGSREHMNVTSSLSCFLYDSVSLDYFLYVPDFLKIISKNIESFLTTSTPHKCPEQHKLEPEVELVSEPEYRPDSPGYLQCERETNYVTGFGTPETFYKRNRDGRTGVAGGIPRSPSWGFGNYPGGCWSPSASSIGSYASLSSPNRSPSVSDGDRSETAALSGRELDFTSGLSIGDSPRRAPDEENLLQEGPQDAVSASQSDNFETDVQKRRIRTLDSELLLLSWFSHTESYLPKLCNPNLLLSLVKYICKTPKPNPRSGRILMRLVRSRALVEELMDCRLHLALAENMCGLGVGGCSGCRDRRELGDELLASLNVQAETTYGIGVLSHRLLGAEVTEEKQLEAAAALPYLLRTPALRKKVMQDQQGLRILIDAFTKIGTDKIMDNFCILVTKSLIQLQNSSKEKQKYTTSSSASSVPSKCICPSLESKSNDDADFVVFTDTSNKTERKIAVQKSVLVAESQYFSAMLAGKFAEAESNVFKINGSEYSFNSFLFFLHFLHGCRNCTDCQPLCGVDILGIIHLADKHFRKQLFEMIICYFDEFLSQDNLTDFFSACFMVGARELCFICVKFVFQHFSVPQIVSFMESIQAASFMSDVSSVLHGYFSLFI